MSRENIFRKTYSFFKLPALLASDHSCDVLQRSMILVWFSKLIDRIQGFFTIVPDASVSNQLDMLGNSPSQVLCCGVAT